MNPHPGIPKKYFGLPAHFAKSEGWETEDQFYGLRMLVNSVMVRSISSSSIPLLVTKRMP